jgi:hypothetical protein
MHEKKKVATDENQMWDFEEFRACEFLTKRTSHTFFIKNAGETPASRKNSRALSRVVAGHSFIFYRVMV